MSAYTIRTAGHAWELAYAAGTDAANRQMRAAGRTRWNLDDRNLSAERTNRMLTSMGFLDASGVPTSLYFAMRADRSAPFVIPD